MNPQNPQSPAIHLIPLDPASLVSVAPADWPVSICCERGGIDLLREARGGLSVTTRLDQATCPVAHERALDAAWRRRVGLTGPQSPAGVLGAPTPAEDTGGKHQVDQTGTSAPTTRGVAPDIRGAQRIDAPGERTGDAMGSGGQPGGQPGGQQGGRRTRQVPSGDPSVSPSGAVPPPVSPTGQPSPPGRDSGKDSGV